MKKKFVLKIKRFKIKKPDLKKLRNLNRSKFFKIALLTFIILFVCISGAVLGFYVAILRNVPSISKLEEYNPNIITNIYSDDGELIGEYALEKRIVITYEEIPDVLKNAIIATEDPRFYSHNGIDFMGILRAVKEDIKLILKPRNLHGGSTISQQLVKKLFLYPKQTVRRKLKEAILALKLERNYSKEEILTMYCNQFNLGHGAYGVEAASQLYFDKNVSELNLAESALIAGIFRAPSAYSSYRKPDLTKRRRNHVLNRMLEEGFITEEEADETKKEPLNVLPLHREDSEFAAYFKEEVRRYLYENYGKESLYKEGLKVYTTLNIEYQEYAEAAVRKGLRVLDKRQGWRKDKKNLLDLGVENLEELEKPIQNPVKNEKSEKLLMDWQKPSIENGKVIEAVVLSVESSKAVVKIKDYIGKMTNKDIAWTKTKNLKSIIKKGDIIHVKVNNLDEEKKELLVSLDQEPLIEGAFLAVEPQTGQIKAMVGGKSFKKDKWNNATQAMRQSGSSIKPILYTAALESGFTPASIIIDEPTEFIDKWRGEPWSPGNYDQRYKGAVTVRKGLEESRNIVTAKLLEFISPQKGVDYCRKFGLTSTIYPYLSLALGTFEVRLIELVSAFTVFPNKGIRIRPYFLTRIEDKDGNILEESKIETEEVISPQTAYMMTYLMQGIIQRGTGRAASYLKWPLGGKTGTTDEYTDAWFVGFSPSLCAGVWVGHDKQISIGERQSGAVAALPVWRDFFYKVIKEKQRIAEENGEEFVIDEEFEVPPNLSFVEIDSKTGLLASPVCLFTIREVFIPGTEPDRFCTHEDHMMILDYYSVKK